MKINGESLVDSLYTAWFRVSSDISKIHFAEVKLKKIVEATKPMEIYMSFEINVQDSINKSFGVLFGETNFKTDIPIEVLYNLEVVSNNQDFYVDLYDDGLSLINVKQESLFKVSGSKKYISDKLNQTWKMYLIEGIFFTRKLTSPIKEFNKTIVLQNLNIAEENIELKIINTENYELISYESPFDYISNLMNTPKVNLNIDGKEMIPQRVDEVGIRKSVRDVLLSDSIPHKDKKFIYYFGVHPKAKANIFKTSFWVQSNSIGLLNINLNYDIRHLIKTDDGINYILDYPGFYIVEKNDDFYENINFKLPQDYYFETSLDSGVGIVNGDILSFSKKGNEYFKFGDLKIKFCRVEKPTLFIIRIVNLGLLILSLLFALLYYVKPKSFRNILGKSNLKLIGEILLIIVGYLYGFSTLFFAKEIFWSAFIYSLIFIPIIISTLVLIIKLKSSVGISN